MLVSPEPFLAILSQMPPDSPWFSSSQASKSAGVAKSRIGSSSPTARDPPSSVAERVRQQIDLLGIVGGGAEDQLAAAGLGEGGDVLAHGLRVLGGAAGDEAGDLLAQPAVVVGQVGVGVRLGVVAEREVSQAHQPRLAL